MLRPYNRIQNQLSFDVPDDSQKISTIDMHTGGEPLRVILHGFPEIQGKNVLDFRRYIKENRDQYRKLLMYEPRGHADMYGCILVPPNDEEADFGIVFMHNEGYSTMCGHAVIAITRLAVEMSWVDKVSPVTEVKIDAPCGRIYSYAKIQEKTVESIYFHGVPSFVVELDCTVQLPDLGEVAYDLAYGGAFYAYVDADRYNIDLDASNYSRLISLGMHIKHAVIESNNNIKHPFEDELSFLYGTIFTSKKSDKANSKNVCIFANGELDRSPTGSGVSGRMAIHYKRGEINLREEMKIESIVGSIFTGSVVKEIEFGPFKAVIPKVEGTAFITGQHTFLLDPNDPFAEGFFLR